MYFTRENLPDILRFISGFLVSLNMLLQSFNLYEISNEQIEAIMNVCSFLFIMYFGYKHNFVTKKDIEAKRMLKENNLHK
ncbi:MAG: phage holin [Bacilli bacterium]